MFLVTNIFKGLNSPIILFTDDQKIIEMVASFPVGNAN